LNNPAENCVYKCSQELRDRVPERKKMKKNSDYEMAIGNLTSQAGSNLNLNEFNHFVIEHLNLTNYVRYVDDMVVISNNKEELEKALPKMIDKLKETH